MVRINVTDVCFYLWLNPVWFSTYVFVFPNFIKLKVFKTRVIRLPLCKRVSPRTTSTTKNSTILLKICSLMRWNKTWRLPLDKNVSMKTNKYIIRAPMNFWLFYQCYNEVLKSLMAIDSRGSIEFLTILIPVLASLTWK